MEKERFGAPLYLQQSNLRSFIFSRSDSLIFFKSTDKIAEIIETCLLYTSDAADEL